jgi:hypothetical protein
VAADTCEHYDPLRVPKRKQPQNELVYQRKDSSVGADSQGQGQYRDPAEDGRFAKAADSEVEIPCQLHYS